MCVSQSASVLRSLYGATAPVPSAPHALSRPSDAHRRPPPCRSRGVASGLPIPGQASSLHGCATRGQRAVDSPGERFSESERTYVKQTDAIEILTSTRRGVLRAHVPGHITLDGRRRDPGLRGQLHVAERLRAGAPHRCRQPRERRAHGDDRRRLAARVCGRRGAGADVFRKLSGGARRAGHVHGAQRRLAPTTAARCRASRARSMSARATDSQFSISGAWCRDRRSRRCASLRRDSPTAS